MMLKLPVTMSVDYLSPSPVGSLRAGIKGLIEVDLAIVTLFCPPLDTCLGNA